MITKPMPFNEAIGFLLDKEQLPAEWNAADWREQEADFRTKAFFSAKVENARFVDRAQGLLFDYLAKVRDDVTTPDGVRTTALRVAGREHFVKLMREFMLAEGMAKEEEMPKVNQKDVTDIRSMGRLRLIFDTNVRQSYGFGQWKQGMKPAVLRAFPAARLIRDMGVKEPRPRHQANLGEVRLKTDKRWAEFHNDPEIGGFGVPWGPYGYNSGCTQEDVSRATAIRLGLIRADEEPQPQAININDGLKASIRNMDPALKAKLLAELRGGPKPRDPAEAAREAAAKVRREMLNRGLTEAITKGDRLKADQYRSALSQLPLTGLIVVEQPNVISIVTARKVLEIQQSLTDGTVSEDDAIKALVDLGMSEDKAKKLLGLV